MSPLPRSTPPLLVDDFLQEALIATAERSENLPAFARKFLREGLLDFSLMSIIASSGWFDLLVINDFLEMNVYFLAQILKGSAYKDGSMKLICHLKNLGFIVIIPHV
jgi:hypothetical protein